MSKQSRFAKEFESEAVRLAETSGRMQREIAEDLGVGISTLVCWIGRSRDRQIDHPPSDRQDDMAAELKQREKRRAVETLMKRKSETMSPNPTPKTNPSGARSLAPCSLHQSPAESKGNSRFPIPLNLTNRG